MSIVIDSTTFDLPIENVDRKIDMLYSSAERTQDGVLHSVLIGVYINLSVQMAPARENLTEYNNLVDKLMEPVESHTITYDGSTWSCYFANINDKLERNKGTPYYRDLSFDVIAIGPAATP